MPGMTEAYEWEGRTVVGSDGEKIGKVEEVYVDEANEQLEWMTVKTGLFGGKASFVPVAGAEPDGEQVRVPFDKSKVKGAPGVEADGELSESEERQLFGHYGVPYTTEGSTTAQGGPGLGHEPRESRGEGRDVSGPNTDDAMTRSEEELHVGTQRREAGRARLRKYVVTENQTRTVPVQREEVRIEREPITDENRDQAMGGKDISDEEHEVTLHSEEAVVEKRTVPKERVRMGTEAVTDEQTVSEEVRKEQIETEGEHGRGRDA